MDRMMDAPAFDLPEFVSRFQPLFADASKEKFGKCAFCDGGERSFRVSATAWRCHNCCGEEVNGSDHIGFYASWCACSREEAAAKLGNGAGLPDAKPVTQVPQKRLPYWGGWALDKPALKDKAVWVHELSGAVLVWRELVPERVHLGLIHGESTRNWSELAKRKLVLVPEANEPSRSRMADLAACLYLAGHKQVMCLDLGLDERFGTRLLPEPGEDVLKWAKARSKPYPKPNDYAAPRGADPDAGTTIPASHEAGAAPNTAQEAPSGTPQRAQTHAKGNGEADTAVIQPALTWDGLNLILGAKGEVKACEHNAKELMAAAKQYDCLHFDKFLYRVRLGERDWSDADDRDAVCWLQSAHQVSGFTLNQARTAAMALAHARQHDSLFEFVMGLPEWDGIPRIETAFIEAWGAPDTALTRAASRNFFVALHARAVKPGAQVDSLWAIEGPQGKFKSASLRALGEHFHAEITAQIGSADFLRELRGIWIAELSEMDSLRGREASTVKRLLSAPSDRFVEKFEKHATAYPRRAVTVATTNEATYWQDSTGGRRLIPIPIGAIRLDLIAANRLQWFAEARSAYQADAKWWEFPSSAAGEQEERQAVDPWEDTLRSCVDNGRMDQDGYAKPWPEGWIASAEIMSDWLKLNSAQLGKASSTRLGHVMRRLGFEPMRSAKGDARGWAPTGWRRGEDEPEFPDPTQELDQS